MSIMDKPDDMLRVLMCEVFNLRKYLDELEERIAVLEQVISDEDIELDFESWFESSDG